MQSIPNSEIRDFLRKAKGPYCCFHDTPMGLRFMIVVDWDGHERPSLRKVSEVYWVVADFKE